MSSFVMEVLPPWEFVKCWLCYCPLIVFVAGWGLLLRFHGEMEKTERMAKTSRAWLMAASMGLITPALTYLCFYFFADPVIVFWNDESFGARFSHTLSLAFSPFAAGLLSMPIVFVASFFIPSSSSTE